MSAGGRPASPAAASPAAAAGPSLADEEVVGRVVAGDHGLFEILVRRYNQRLFRVARAIVGDPAEAEDVVQEAHLSAFRELAGFRGEASFATWLTRIAVHEALARVRRRRRLVAVGDEGPSEPSDEDAAADPERSAATRELREAIGRAVDGLPDPLRSVFVLREIEGLDGAAVGEALGISPENVRVRLHRAKRALRAELDERIGREVRRLWLFAGWRCDRVTAAVLARLPSSP